MAVRAEKEQLVGEIAEKMKAARSLVLTDYRGLDVRSMNELRSNLREANVEYRVVKNTMVYLAAKELGLAEELEPYLRGPTAIAFGYDDAVAPAKGVSDYARDHDKLEIKAGVLNGELIGVEKVKALADLPSREELLGQTVRAMLSPLQGLANVLSAPLRDFASVLSALREEREKSAA